MYQPFFGSYLPASKLELERLTVGPCNPRLEVRFSGLYFLSISERWIYVPVFGGQYDVKSRGVQRRCVSDCIRFGQKRLVAVFLPQSMSPVAFYLPSGFNGRRLDAKSAKRLATSTGPSLSISRSWQ